MPIHNADVAAIFDEIADLLEIENANPFRVRAYRNAAREMQELGVSAADLIKKGEPLTDIPGIGDSLAVKIKEIVDTGKCQALEKLRKQTPPSVTELLQIPGLGPKRVRTIYHELDVQTVEQLLRAARDGRIRQLHGFGEKTEERIIEAIETHIARPGRFKLAMAAQYAESLREYLNGVPNVARVEIAGSYRRARETVGDLDIVVSATDPNAVMSALVDYDEVTRVVSKGSTRATIILRSGIQVDVRVVDPASFGAMLVYFTGSKAHNIQLRTMARERGLKINEYGVFRGKRCIASESEASVYRAMDLPWIEPELRENHGEIEAATLGKLPKLVVTGDLKGDLHAHTNATDGHNTLREMADAAKAYGLDYLAITEHSRRLAMAHGLDPQRLRRRNAEIDKLNGKLRGITLLKGIEVDILEDGDLDLPDEVLSELDLVVGAIHSKFDLSRAKQTTRVLRAMDHPCFHILAHPTGRLIDRRAPYDIDMLRVIRHARQRGCFLELNAHPERLDLLDIYCQMAKEEKVLIAINSDAHSIHEFDNLKYGVGQARRGWLEKDDILNTRSLKALQKLLKNKQ